MWQFIRSRILALIIFVGATHGLLVVGPKFIRGNQDYTLVISNFKSDLNKVDLVVNVSGEADNGLSALNVTKTVEVRKFMNRVVNFNMPKDLSAGSYKITIDGQRGFSFHKEADLVYLDKSISGLIQIDKPVFNPGDTVKFRVIVLDTELKPPTSVRSVYVTIRDPQKNVIRKWASAMLYAGMFESDLQIAPTPMLGIWEIEVQVKGEELVSKTFEVKEYVLSTFDVQIAPSVVPLEEHQALNLTIAANYHFGKPVNGLAKIELCLEDDKLDQKKELVMYGMGQVELRFAGNLEVYDDYREVQVKVSFVEQYTNRIVVKNEKIKVFKYPYRVELVKESSGVRSGHTYKCALKFTYHDGKPAAGIKGNVEINVDHNPLADTSDSNGLIKLELQPDESTEVIVISFSIDDSDFYFFENINKVEIVTNAYVKLELKSPIKLNRHLRLLVTCTELMTFLVYYVVSKGNIIDAGYMRPNKQTEYSMQLNATEKMVPKATIIVATVASRTVVFDYVDIDFQELRNNFDLSIDEREVKPGRQIELSMSGRPGAYVGLAAYDKALLLHSKHHDLFWEDIQQVFDGFHAINWNEFNVFQSMGIFVRISDDMKIDFAHHRSKRNSNKLQNDMTRQNYRKHFSESWLWKNVILGKSGNLTLIEKVPNSISSWYLTGFSIHPVYGLGIIKKPIQFTTTQLFYLEDNLPYSIRRGEVAVLQFTLFNNRTKEHTVDITLNNVNNHMEFIGRPSEELSYTKSVSVPPNVGVPIRFMVKAQKLGEIMVQVNASIGNGLDTDTLVKVILVTPESLMQSNMESHMIDMATYSNETFFINFDIDKKADKDSKNIEFRVYPNLVTSAEDKVKMLLPKLCRFGESETVLIALNIGMVHYLNVLELQELNFFGNATDLILYSFSNMSKNFQDPFVSPFISRNYSRLFQSAFVASALNIVSTYMMETDLTMVEKIYDWLASNQDSSGRFGEVVFISPNMEKKLLSGVRLTSYIAATMQENAWAKAKHAKVIEKAIAYLSNQILSITDAYDLSIATYALMLNGHKMKDVALKNLMKKSSVTNGGVERYWQSSNSIQTTAYALLSLIADRKYTQALPIMHWLVNQHFHSGSISSITTTFVHLKALTEITKKMSPSQNDYSVHILSDNLTHIIKIGSQDRSTVYFNGIPKSANTVQVNVVGRGFGLLQVAYAYNLNLCNFEHHFQLDVVRQNTSSNIELRLRVCVHVIDHDSILRSNRTFVEVTFPSGYIVDENPISEQTAINSIQEIEIRFGSTVVVVYFSNLNVERNCFTVTAYRRFKVALRRPAYVVAYDFYDRNLNAIKSYEVDEQHVSDI